MVYLYIIFNMAIFNLINSLSLTVIFFYLIILFIQREIIINLINILYSTLALL